MVRALMRSIFGRNAGLSFRSINVHLTPRWPRSMASVRPTGPAPTIRTWVSDNEELLKTRSGMVGNCVLAGHGVLPRLQGGVIWRVFPGLYPVPPGPAGLSASGPSVGAPG